MREIIDRLEKSKKEIALFGDVMLDYYLIGETDRISPEAPIQVIDIESEKYLLGGAGNVANNLISFGSDVTFFSVIGDDEDGKRVLNILDDLSVNISGVIKDKDRKTTIKSRILSRGQQIIRFDKESRSNISQNIENMIIDKFERNIKKFDVVLISDYGKGVISDSLSKKVIQISNQYGVKVLIDPKGDDYSKYSDAYLIKPNRKEAIESLNIGSDIDLIGKKLIENYRFENLIITLSEDGMKLFKKDREIEIFPTKAKDIFDVTGAGDTVLASLGIGIASKLSLKDSIHFSNSATAIVIGKVGTSTVTFKEVINYEKHKNIDFGDSKLKDWKELKNLINFKRDQKIIFTNGCFDILHIGHVKYLEKAKSFGDVLIVGLNSDSSVRKLKGESRPINCEDDRAYLLAGLKSVDFVTVFSEDTPYELIKYLKPDVVVKGGDYRGKHVVGSNIVDEVKLVDFVDGKSTSKIVEKIECKC